MADRRSLLNPEAPEYIPSSLRRPIPHHLAPAYLPRPFTPYQLPPSTTFSTPNTDHHYLPNSVLNTPPPPPPPPPSPTGPLRPPPPQSPPPPPTVDPTPQEVARQSSTRAPRNIPPRLIMFRPRNVPPRMRSSTSYVLQRGRKVWVRRESCRIRGNSSEGFGEKLQKHYVIPLTLSEKISTTSVMIKNIPYSYNREMMVQFLDDHCSLENQKANDGKGQQRASAYDYFYLPMDFKTKKSKGYAFVNFTNHQAVAKFFGAFDNKLNVFPGSIKPVKIVTAQIQGKEALVKRFEHTIFECESEEFLPVWFSPARNGSGESVTSTTVGKCRATSTSAATSWELGLNRSCANRKVRMDSRTLKISLIFRVAGDGVYPVM